MPRAFARLLAARRVVIDGELHPEMERKWITFDPDADLVGPPLHPLINANADLVTTLRRELVPSASQNHTWSLASDANWGGTSQCNLEVSDDGIGAYISQPKQKHAQMHTHTNTCTCTCTHMHVCIHISPTFMHACMHAQAERTRSEREKERYRGRGTNTGKRWGPLVSLVGSLILHCPIVRSILRNLAKSGKIAKIRQGEWLD